MSVARTTTFSLPSSHEGHGMGTGGVPSDLWPTLGHNCGESQDLGELLNPAGQAESLGAERSMFFSLVSASDAVVGGDREREPGTGGGQSVGGGGGGGGHAVPQSKGPNPTESIPEMMPFFAHVHPMYQVPHIAQMAQMPVSSVDAAGKANGATEGVSSVIVPPMGCVAAPMGCVAAPMGCVAAPVVSGMAPMAPIIAHVGGIPGSATQQCVPMHPQAYAYPGYYLYYQNVNGALTTFSVPYTMVTPPSSTESDSSVYSLLSGLRGDALRRKQAVERYKRKKANRSFKKNIRYQMRKDNADKRVRVKGRFAKEEG